MILAIDTSTGTMLAALADDSGNVIDSVERTASEAERGVHDARLAIEVEALLKVRDIPPKSITRVGIVIGPGSFTGLRIGLAFAKGFCFATGAGIVPLTQHELLASDYAATRYLLTPGYRKGLYYLAETDRPKDPRLIERRELMEINSGGVVLHPSFKESREPELENFTVASYDRAAVICRLAAENSQILGLDEIRNLVPLYLTEFKTDASK